VQTFVALVLGTLVSEDLTCIAAGLLIQRGHLGLTEGIIGCAAGIVAGDCGLWLLGRLFGAAALAWPWTARKLKNGRADEIRAWLERHAAGAIVASRFLPGTRVPLYITAGMVGLPGAVFAVWALVASLLWTPTLVLLTATLGDVFIARVRPFVGVGWVGGALVAASVWLLLFVGRLAASGKRRQRVSARVARWSRWEFWPTWLFYAPVGLWVLWLALRHRGLSTLTAANPGIQDGGTVGESKFDILSKLPSAHVVPSLLIARGSVVDRLAAMRSKMESADWGFPIVLKPDVGQRGTGVKLVRDVDQAGTYFASIADAVVAQPYHEGPFEAGIFYYRMPDATHGHILSITDKHFPVLYGDGVSTIEELIWSHPRYRLQADTFVARHRDALGRVLESGERWPLGIAGNHCQGTTFRNGAHLVTPALVRRIDEIARAIPGFFVGRFDVRYADVEAFMAGDDLAIVELNGATAESTSIYDPSTSLYDAYRQLSHQWSIVFSIGAANRAAGAAVTSHRRLFDLVRAHLSATEPCPISD
jgi:membrane protein DedA with SNARE-associated domain